MGLKVKGGVYVSKRKLGKNRMGGCRQGGKKNTKKRKVGGIYHREGEVRWALKTIIMAIGSTQTKEEQVNQWKKGT